MEGCECCITANWLPLGNTESDRRTLRATPAGYEPMMRCDELVETVVLMAPLPPHVHMLEAIVLPIDQLFAGRR